MLVEHLCDRHRADGLLTMIGALLVTRPPRRYSPGAAPRIDQRHFSPVLMIGGLRQAHPANLVDQCLLAEHTLKRASLTLL